MSQPHPDDPELMAEKKTKTEPEPNGEKPFLSPEDMKLLREQYLRDYHPDDVEMFLRRCERTRIDPMTGQIFMRPDAKEQDARGPDGKYKKALTITGVQGFLNVADRSGVYDGEEPILWCGQDGQWTDVWLQAGNPIASKATVWRKDRRLPSVAVVKWKAVNKPGWAWQSMPDHMLGKCALCAALRKAFPSQLTGVYETDEIAEKEGPAATLEQDVETQRQRIAEAEAAKERLNAQGVPTVQPSAPVFPRDAKDEVQPAKGLEPKEYQPGDETQEEIDEIDMAPEGEKKRSSDWWMHLDCDLIHNQYYNGKKVHELSPNLIRQAVEKWVPKVRAKGDAAPQAYRELAEALEIAWEEAQRVAAQQEATAAASASEGPQ